MTEEQSWVGLSDVVSWVDPDDFQTSQPSESGQLRGKWSCRRGREPAYCVRGDLPSAIIPSQEPMGDVEYINDVQHQRLSESEIARVQTFPDSFDWTPDTVSETRQLIGNAVPPRLAEAVAGGLP